MHTASGGANACSHATTGDVISREPSFLSRRANSRAKLCERHERHELRGAAKQLAVQISTIIDESAQQPSRKASRVPPFRAQTRMSRYPGAKRHVHKRTHEIARGRQALFYFERQRRTQASQVQPAVFTRARTKSQKADWRSFILWGYFQ